MTAILLVFGLVLLVAGGDLLVRGATAAAKAMGVSPLMIGLTLVGFGTSTPELVTSVTAALEGAPGIAVGNVVGSNIANILLILGVGALIFPLAVDPRGFRRDSLVVVGAALACAATAIVGEVDRAVGLLFVLALGGYLVWVYRQERLDDDPAAVVHAHMAEDAPPGPRRLTASLLLAALGIALTILGARWLVTGSIELAQRLGVSDAVIGLTIVAVGTSLPELVTIVVAALRRHADVAYGNVVGSNIYNVLGILGTTALVQPIEVPAEILARDIWLMLAATGLLVLFARTGFTLHRWEGFLFLAGYVAYVASLAVLAGPALAR
jgi:cation:H+ antiporter